MIDRETRASVIDSARTLKGRQIVATRLLGSDARHILFYGGARSSKTFLLVRAMIIRALKARGSRHLIARFRFAHVKQHVALDTFPKVMRICFPGVPFKMDRSDWYVKFPNESEIWFGGLDEKERTEKILGAEYSTIYLNEISQISWQTRNTVMTRLAQRSGLKLKAYYDCNPPSRVHWSYKMFVKNEDPTTGQPLPDADVYASMLLNPEDNRENIHPDYFAELDALPERLCRRFRDGEWLPANEFALWDQEWFDAHRRGEAPSLKRVVVAIDPAVSSLETSDKPGTHGIIAAGLGEDGRGYVVADASLQGTPLEWARRAVALYDDREADIVVAEINQGGEMVKSTLRSVRPALPIKLVRAARGKHIRAEPIAALYEQGRISHVGRFPDLEDQLCMFTNAGFEGQDSPDRADALVWALNYLFSDIIYHTGPEAEAEAPRRRRDYGAEEDDDEAESVGWKVF